MNNHLSVKTATSKALRSCAQLVSNWTEPAIQKTGYVNVINK